MSYLRHVTLTSGHSRDSYREEVADEVVEVCRGLIDAMATEGEVTSVAIQIPGVGPYSIAGQVSGRCLAATVYRDGDPVPVCTIGIAAHSRCGAGLWRDLHRWGQVPVVTSPDRCPPAPWVAAALDEGALRHPEALTWLGDFERCLGWAWLDRVRGGVR